MDCERRLYNAETETDRTRAVNMKLMVTIDDLKLKINGKGGEDVILLVWSTYGQVSCLEALDTFGTCQRPVFSLGVSQHMHKIINLNL